MKQLKLYNFIALLQSKLTELGYQNRATGARDGGKNWGDFAEKAGIDRTSVGHYLSGKYKPTMRNLTKIADALQVDLSYFGVNEKAPATVGSEYVRKTKRPYVKKNAKCKPKLAKADFRLLELNTNQLSEIEIHWQSEDNELLLIKITN